MSEPASHSPIIRRDPRLDLLKWLAVLCMVLDHVRYLGWPPDALYVPGRLAFPWFCLAIAANLARPGRAGPRWRYLGLMLLFALMSEVPYRLYVVPHDTFSVMPTLALGLLLASAWQQRTPGALVMGGGALLIAILWAPDLMFGLSGVLLPLSLLWVWRRPIGWALLPGLLCLAGNAWEVLLESARQANPVAIGGILTCLLAPGLGLLLLRHGPSLHVPPMRRWAYAIYPLHFLALLGVRLLLRSA